MRVFFLATDIWTIQIATPQQWKIEYFIYLLSAARSFPSSILSLPQTSSGLSPSLASTSLIPHASTTDFSQLARAGPQCHSIREGPFCTRVGADPRGSWKERRGWDRLCGVIAAVQILLQSWWPWQNCFFGLPLPLFSLSHAPWPSAKTFGSERMFLLLCFAKGSLLFQRNGEIHCSNPNGTWRQQNIGIAFLWILDFFFEIPTI